MEADPATPPPSIRRFASPHTATPATQLLSNGSYTVMITAAGSGFSRWRDVAVTRWRDDTTCDDTGSYVFLRDVTSGVGWSAGFQPSGVEALRYDASLADDQVAITRRDGAIETRLDVIVAAAEDGELRRVSITNHDTVARDIDVTSYAEIVLATAASDAAHPAFSNLFVETECEIAHETLLATRRRGMPDDVAIWLAHSISVQGESVGALEWETSRERFLGRGRTVHAPQAERKRYVLSNTVGPVLDPIVSLRRCVRVQSGETARLTFATFVAPSREAALALGDKYRGAAAFASVADALQQSRLAAEHDRMEPGESELFQTLAGHVLYPDRSLRSARGPSALHAEGVDALWEIAISGDLPLVVVVLDDDSAMELVRPLLRAHAYWRSKCLWVDMVFVNELRSADGARLQAQVEDAIRAAEGTMTREALKLHGQAFAFRAEALTVAHRSLLKRVARVNLASARGTLADQLAAIVATDAAAPPRPPHVAEVATTVMSTAMSTSHLEFFNGSGGFDRDGSEYVTVVRPGHWTPAPWVNVIANADFGCLVSECGAGGTWSRNSQQNLLTSWSNDPVSDPPSEMFYLRDEESEQVWTPTPLPIREHTGEYVVRHGHGYTRFERESHGVALDLLQFVPRDDPIKISRLTITNRSPRFRRLSVTGYVEWVLGVTRSASAPHVTTEMDGATGAMFARNSFNRDFGKRIAFADLGGTQQSWTGDRTEFLGRNGTSDRPAAIASGAALSGRVGTALDPCCALQTFVELPVGGQVTVVFLLGQTETRDAARALITRYRAADLDARLAAVTDGWADVLNAVQVKTPDRALDIMLNQWLLYQTLACRIWARTAFYQASGAFGFRDQLQDVMAIAVTRPDLTRAHILKAASRQFEEGDVQHWWHEPAGRGVRTRITDDRLWLPYAASHYLAVTADDEILDEEISFLNGPALAEGQNEAYFAPTVSDVRGTLFEHCARALDRSLAVGAHGLPLMGTGDWNDGMNRVGVEGKGESVWLAWFLYTNLLAWAKLAAARGEPRRADVWAEHAHAIKQAAEREAWDGAWYRRAYFDDGTPLGTADADACAIDAIAQSWSVISGAADGARARRAMDSLDQHLVRHHDKLVLLLTPPFDKTALEPGYIKGYVPGIRENGGQYTHAAVWSVIACAELGHGDRAAELFAMLNPINHSSTPSDVQRYRVEPYVSVGHVYSEPPHVGRGGWSWYSGSAGWMYRAGVEWLLGIRVHGTRLLIAPCIPAAWPGFSVALRHRSARYDIRVENPGGVCRGVATISLDGTPLGETDGLSLVDDGRTHDVRVMMAHPSPTPDRKP